MNLIDIIKQLTAAGIARTADIAEELNRRSVQPPTDDDRWTTEDVSRLLFAEAMRRRQAGQ
jgi:uncharacterized protein (DUF2336 family)